MQSYGFIQLMRRNTVIENLSILVYLPFKLLLTCKYILLTLCSNLLFIQFIFYFIIVLFNHFHNN